MLDKLSHLPQESLIIISFPSRDAGASVSEDTETTGSQLSTAIATAAAQHSLSPAEISQAEHEARRQKIKQAHVEFCRRHGVRL